MTYTNPLTHEDFPDATILHVPGEGYYAYATHDEFSPSIVNVQVKFSTDLVHWGVSLPALKENPVWAKECKKFWCPDVVAANGEYRMYYAAEPDTKDGMCLAFATATHPLDFVDCGFPFKQEHGSSYEMIDPCFFIDPVSHRHLLYYGSAHQPIRVVELSADGRFNVTEPIAVLYPSDQKFQRLREGAFVTYKKELKRYFLWVSGDNTWAENGYAVSVYWSEDPLATFQPIPGDPVILRANERWDAPGHNSILKDESGQEWMIYHAVDKNDPFIPGTDRFLRKMCMDKVNYSAEGWPYIDGGSPSFTEREAPVTK